MYLLPLPYPLLFSFRFFFFSPSLFTGLQLRAGRVRSEVDEISYSIDSTLFPFLSLSLPHVFSFPSQPETTWSRVVTIIGEDNIICGRRLFLPSFFPSRTSFPNTTPRDVSRIYKWVRREDPMTIVPPFPPLLSLFPFLTSLFPFFSRFGWERNSLTRKSATACPVTSSPPSPLFSYLHGRKKDRRIEVKVNAAASFSPPFSPPPDDFFLPPRKEE